MATKEQIIEALSSLEVTNHAQWTGDGSPRMDVLQALTGDPNLTRKDVTNVAPRFSRETAHEPIELSEAPTANTVSATSGQGSVASPLVAEVAPAAQATPADGEVDPDNAELTELERQLAEAQRLMEAAENDLNNSRKLFDEAQRAVDRLVEAKTSRRTQHDDTLDRMAYINSQTAQRNRAAREMALQRELELHARGLDAASPLDQSMSRRGQRPAIPLKNRKE